MIRKMLESDLEEVVVIEKELYKNPWSIKFYKDDLNKDVANLFVVVEENIVGYGEVYIAGNEADISKVSVRKNKQGQGYGNAVMDEIIRIAKEKDCEKISLEVRNSNTPARNLYTKYGFIEVGVRKKYYSDNEDAIVMVKKLKGI